MTLPKGRGAWEWLACAMRFLGLARGRLVRSGGHARRQLHGVSEGFPTRQASGNYQAAREGCLCRVFMSVAVANKAVNPWNHQQQRLGCKEPFGGGAHLPKHWAAHCRQAWGCRHGPRGAWHSKPVACMAAACLVARHMCIHAHRASPGQAHGGTPGIEFEGLPPQAARPVCVGGMPGHPTPTARDRAT